MIQESLYAALTANPAIVAAAPGGIWPMQGPENGGVYLAYRFVGSTEMPNFDNSGLARARVELTAVAASYSDAAKLRFAVIEGLYGAQDAEPAADGTWLQSARLLSSDLDMFDHEQRCHRCSCEFYLTFSR
jgi:hypothetical protein